MNFLQYKLKKMTEELATTKQGPNFKDVEDGPLSSANRQCRDIICCLLFLGNIGGMVYCALAGLLYGNPDYIYRATSETGSICGAVGTTAENYPYSYFYNPMSSIDKRVCVASCPIYSGGTLQTLSCINGIDCSYDVTVAANGSITSNYTGLDFFGYETQAFLGRICIPSTATLEVGFATASESLSSALSTSFLGDIVEDVSTYWWLILSAFGAAIIISFIFMFVLRCFAGILVWSSLISIFLVLNAAGVLFLYNGGVITSSVLDSFGIPSTNLGYEAYIGYTCFGIAAVFLIVMLCCCSRIRLAVAVCNTAGQFVARVCQILLVPIFQAILIAGFWAFALLVMVYLISASSFVFVSGDVFTTITDYTQSTLLSFYYFVFAALWTNALLQAMTIFVIASSCCMWYYSHGPGQDLNSPVLSSYWMIFRYHFGSFAFGSFILAVVQFLQFMVEVFKKQAEAQGVDQAPMFEYLINCLRCCLACVQRIVQFINKTAYIQIAITGKNFCMAAKDGFEIVFSNGIRYMIVAGVGEIIMFLGKVLISVVTCIAFYCVITFISELSSGILQPIALLAIVAVMSFAVGMVFMAVYSVAMDTLLACFIVDQINQKAKGAGKPLYAPQELANLMETD